MSSSERRRGQHKRPRRQKHLYLVLDDWSKGFSIHKLDADSFDPDDLPVPGGAPGRLAEPPALRLESPVGVAPAMFFSALGTKIFALMDQRCALVHDTETGVLAIGPHAPAPMACGFGFTLPVGDEALYALSHRSLEKRHSLQVMHNNPTEGWTWKTLPAPPPEFRSHVISHALHPDGRTIFVSTPHSRFTTYAGNLDTYTFDTKHSVWKWHGQWALPFIGQGYFDSELDAWVGLRAAGHICSCQVVSPSCHGTTPALPLDLKMTRENLFHKGPERHVTASLTYLGTSKYCLIQTVARDGPEEGHGSGDLYNCVLHLTMFGLKYNHKGELRITDHRSVRSFLVSKHTNYFFPYAFWM